MKSLIRYERKGSTELIPMKHIESEIAEVKILGKKTWIYLGVYPQIIEKGSFMGTRRARLYMVRQGEPFARDSFTGKYADPEKMFRAMLSKKAMDKFTLLINNDPQPDEAVTPIHTDRTLMTVEEYFALQEKLKGEPIPEDIETRIPYMQKWLKQHDYQVFTFEDVSEMEYLLEEALLLTESKVAQGLAESAKKEFMNARDITMWLLIIIAFAFSFAVYYGSTAGF